MKRDPLKPLRVVLALLGGLAIGFVLIKVMTPHPDGLEAADAEEAPPVEPIAGAPKAATTPPPHPFSRISQQRLAQNLPAYPSAGPWVHIGDVLDTDRVPMALVSFETKDSDVKVFEFYATYFEHAGMPWQGIKESLDTVGVPALSATADRGDLQLSIVAFAHEGGTTVILSAADMQTYYDRLNAEASDESDLPKYPGSQPAVMRATEGARDSMMISFSTPDGADQVASFYRTTLPSLGFHEVASEVAVSSPAMRHLDFSARGKSWRFFMSKLHGGTSVAVQGVREAGP